MTEFQQRTIPGIWDVAAKNDYQNEKQRLVELDKLEEESKKLSEHRKNLEAEHNSIEAQIKELEDIISKIDGTPTESMQSYYTYLQTKKQGENLTITVLRKNSDGEYAEKDYKVTVGER